MTLHVHQHALVPVSRNGWRTGWRCSRCGQKWSTASMFERIECNPEERTLRDYAVAVAKHVRENGGHLPVMFANNLAALAGGKGGAR